MYDTLKATNRIIKEGNMERKQAEALVNIIGEAFSHLVTKKEFEFKLRDLENRMTIKLGSIVVISNGVFTSVLLFFKFFAN